MAKEPDYVNGQPAPILNNGKSIHDLVRRDLATLQKPATPIHNRAIMLLGQDMVERKAYGLAKYGTILQAHNGRDALTDAMEEALDLAVYIRQSLEEGLAEKDPSARDRVNSHMLRLAYGEILQAMTYIKTVQMGS